MKNKIIKEEELNESLQQQVSSPKYKLKVKKFILNSQRKINATTCVTICKSYNNIKITRYHSKQPNFSFMFFCSAEVSRTM